MRPTVWKLFECPGGARWSSVSEDYSGQVCTFSGCNCGGRVTCVGTSEDRTFTHNWFRRPSPLPQSAIEAMASTDTENT